MTGSTFPFYLVSVFYCHFYQNLMNLKVLANQGCSIRKAEKLPLYSLISQWNASISSDESSYLSSSQVHTLVFSGVSLTPFCNTIKHAQGVFLGQKRRYTQDTFHAALLVSTWYSPGWFSTTRNKNHQTKLITLLSTSLSTLTK